MTKKNQYFAIIDRTDAAMEKFGRNSHGDELFEISRLDIEALLAGKVLAIEVNRGEYGLFIAVADCEK